MIMKLVAAMILELILDRYTTTTKFQELIEEVMLNYDDAVTAYPDVDVFYNQVSTRLNELTTLLYDKVQLELQIAAIVAQIGSI